MKLFINLLLSFLLFSHPIAFCAEMSPMIPLSVESLLKLKLPREKEAFLEALNHIDEETHRSLFADVLMTEDPMSIFSLLTQGAPLTAVSVYRNEEVNEDAFSFFSKLERKGENYPLLLSTLEKCVHFKEKNPESPVSWQLLSSFVLAYQESLLLEYKKASREIIQIIEVERGILEELKGNAAEIASELKYYQSREENLSPEERAEFLGLEEEEKEITDDISIHLECVQTAEGQLAEIHERYFPKHKQAFFEELAERARLEIASLQAQPSSEGALPPLTKPPAEALPMSRHGGGGGGTVRRERQTSISSRRILPKEERDPQRSSSQRRAHRRGASLLAEGLTPGLKLPSLPRS